MKKKNTSTLICECLLFPVCESITDGFDAQMHIYIRLENSKSNRKSTDSTGRRKSNTEEGKAFQFSLFLLFVLLMSFIPCFFTIILILH